MVLKDLGALCFEERIPHRGFPAQCLAIGKMIGRSDEYCRMKSPIV